jgi:hypothetical protein
MVYVAWHHFVSLAGDPAFYAGFSVQWMTEVKITYGDEQARRSPFMQRKRAHAEVIWDDPTALVLVLSKSVRTSSNMMAS